MKQISWFKFCPADWMMGRISRQPAEVQVAFIRLCCVYWNAECEMSTDHAELEADGHLERLLQTRLVESNGPSVFIKFLDIQWEEANLHRTKMSQAGKRSAERRLSKVEESPTKVEPMLNLPSTNVEPVFNREEERREEKKRGENTCVLFDQFWNLYPRKTSKQSASKAFAKLKDEDQQAAINNIARLYAETPVQFVPHAATYLNQGRWEDQAIARTNTFANPLNQTDDEPLPSYR
jgi:hypothetical protein